jgi:hypothetical protein
LTPRQGLRRVNFFSFFPAKYSKLSNDSGNLAQIWPIIWPMPDFALLAFGLSARHPQTYTRFHHAIIAIWGPRRGLKVPHETGNRDQHTHHADGQAGTGGKSWIIYSNAASAAVTASSRADDLVDPGHHAGSFPDPGVTGPND